MNPFALEELEYEFNARYDYISEAYGATIRDCNDFAAEEARFEWSQAWINVCDEMEAWQRPCLLTFNDEIPF